MKRRGIAALLGGALIWSCPAQAAPERTSSLGWTRLASAETCIPAHALAEAVEARLHKSVFVSASRADIAVEGHVERLDGAWHAEIAITDKAGKVLGTRELSKTFSDCRELDEDLVLAIALMIDPDSLLGPPPPPPIVPTPPPVVPNLVQAAPVFTAPRARSEPWQAGVKLGPSFSLGLLPKAGAGLTLRGEIAPPHFIAFALGGTLWFPNDEQVSPLGAEVRFAEGFVSACPLVMTLSTMSLRGCAGARVGVLHVGGFGFAVDDAKERMTASAALEARIRQKVAGPLVLSVGPSLLVPFVRDTFAYADARRGQLEVFKMSAVAAILDILLGIEMP